MEFFKPNTRWDMMGQRKYFAALSIVLITLSLGSLGFRWFHLGIDFSGGTLVELSYAKPADLDGIRKTLVAAGFEGASAQHFGSTRDVSVRLPLQAGMSGADLSKRVLEALSADPENQVELRRVEFVGPQVGEELAEKGGLAFLIALIGILAYVAVRYEFRFAVGAVVATLHDIVITVGFFSLTGMEFDLTVLAAVLAIMGYSVNDTVVVYDRIRENFRRMRKEGVVEIVNASVNQTLSRTIMTSVATLLVVVALFFFGGQVIYGFSVALIVGIVVGTYSSIYVASAMAVALGISKADFVPVKKEGADFGRP